MLLAGSLLELFLSDGPSALGLSGLNNSGSVVVYYLIYYNTYLLRYLHTFALEQQACVNFVPLLS